jgi:hypothetical protein
MEGALVDFGRQAFIDLMASRDPTIRRLIGDGYEFVTNAFQPGRAPGALRVKDAQAVAERLRREGYLAELAPAYNEIGDPVPAMQSVWRRPLAVRRT